MEDTVILLALVYGYARIVQLILQAGQQKHYQTGRNCPIEQEICIQRRSLINMDNTEMLQKILTQVEENTQILKALEENSQVHNSRLENIENKLAYIEGDIKRTKNKANLALNNAAQNRLDIANIKEN